MVCEVIVGVVGVGFDPLEGDVAVGGEVDYLLDEVDVFLAGESAVGFPLGVPLGDGVEGVLGVGEDCD